MVIVALHTRCRFVCGAFQGMAAAFGHQKQNARPNSDERHLNRAKCEAPRLTCPVRSAAALKGGDRSRAFVDDANPNKSSR